MTQNYNDDGEECGVWTSVLLELFAFFINVGLPLGLAIVMAVFIYQLLT